MFKSQSVSTQLFKSYVLLLTLSIFIFFCFFTIQYKGVEQDIYETNDIILTSVEDRLNDIFTEMQQIYIEMCMNNNFRKTPNLFKRSFAEGMFSAKEVHYMARLYPTLNNSIDEIYVRYLESDMAFSTQSGINKSDTINDIVFEDEAVKELENFIENNPRGGFCDLGLKQQRENVFCYVGTYPVNVDYEKAECMIIICADMSFFDEKIGALVESAQKDILVLNERNDVIYSTTHDLEIDVEKRTQGTYRNREQVVSFVELETTGWFCAVSTPTKIFWKRLNLMRMLTIASVVLCLILGGVCIAFFVRKNYAPVKKLMTTLKNKTGNSADEENEYVFLQKTLFEILDSNKNQMKQLNQQEQYLKNRFLLAMLQGNADMFETENKEINIKWVSNKYIIVAYDASDYELLFSDEENISSEKRRDLLSFLVDNIMSEQVACDGHLCYTLNIRDKIVLIINLSSDEEGAQRKIENCCNVCRTVFESQFGYALNAVISDICHDKKTVSQAYYDVSESIDFIRLNKISGVYHCYELRQNTELSYKSDSELQLLSAIFNGESEKVREILDGIFDSRRHVEYFVMQCKIIELLSVLMKSSDDTNEKVKIAQIYNIKSDIDMIKKEIYTVAENICIKKREKMQTGGNKTADRIKKYIDDNYMNPLLSVQMLEDEIGLSRFHMTRCFKGATGTGILEYIRLLRVTRAKEMIEEKASLRMETIATKVGFGDARTLTRAFKQEFGITPSEYRKSIQV